MHLTAVLMGAVAGDHSAIETATASSYSVYK